MITCEEFSSLLERRDEGGLNEAEEAELAAHAQTCARCLMLLDLRRLDADVEVPPQASKAWRAALEKGKETKMKREKTFAWKQWVAVAAAAVFVAFGASAVHQMDLSASKQARSGYTAPTGNSVSYGEVSEKTYDMAANSPESFDGANQPMLSSRSATDGGSKETSVPETASRETKIIRNASLTIKTQTFEDDLAVLKSGVESLNGRIESMSINGDGANGTLRSASLTLRVPAEKLDEFLLGAQSVKGRVTASSQSSEDVSDTYYDIQARLDTQKAKLARLNELMKQATDVSDLIEIESAAGDAQYMIDAYQGQISGYDSQVSMSTVTVSLREETVKEAAEATDTSFLTRVKNGLSASWKGIGTFFSDAGVFLVMAAPWLALLAAATGIVVLCVRAKRKKTDK